MPNEKIEEIEIGPDGQIPMSEHYLKARERMKNPMPIMRPGDNDGSGEMKMSDHYLNAKKNRGKIETEEWALDGVMVDEQIVLRPETQTIDQMLGEENVEVRRVRIEQYGWLKFLEEVNAKTIDERHNDIDATKEALFFFSHGNINHKIFVPTCTTGRVFALEVPETVETCVEAQKYLAADDELDELPPSTPIGRS